MISQNQEENCHHHTNLITEDERKLDLTTAANIREETGQTVKGGIGLAKAANSRHEAA